LERKILQDFFWERFIKGDRSNNHNERDNSEIETSWENFEENFLTFYCLPQGAHSKYFLELECLKHLLGVKKYKGRNKEKSGIVTFEKFVRFLDWFGPLSPTSGKVVETLVYLKKLYSKKWFFGFMEDQKSRDLLLESPNKSYLVRASSQKGCFTLMVHIKGEVKMYRYDRVPDLTIEVEESVKKQKLLKPVSGCPGDQILSTKIINYIGVKTVEFDFLSLLNKNHE